MQRMAVTDPNTLLGDIVRLCPASLGLFARHNLDLCCEAGDSLEAVARRHKLDLGRLLGEIDEAMGTGQGRSSTGCRNSNPAALTRFLAPFLFMISEE